eukprot:CAMPEP_0168747712 /NCGR_PEP_ID=MMETSP0724-20121128/15799_1 /TAXON_ID=265536 /ORGANISM="Amphiprora sp., Strain CCMP467" /LENGTH=600 /DNA_ID=CAMNT_0008795513 /DNA_START=131 /DNA_END=1930 /DNA_ORIENTATION=+
MVTMMWQWIVVTMIGWFLGSVPPMGLALSSSSSGSRTPTRRRQQPPSSSSSPKKKKKKNRRVVVAAPRAQPNNNHNNNPPSVGQQIQMASSRDDLLEAATHLWLPTDDGLAPHLRLQQVHHEKRLRWSAQLLAKLGSISIATTTTMMMMLNDSHNDNNRLLTDVRFERAVLAAALPFENRIETDRVEKELRYLQEALVGLYNVLSVAALSNNNTNDNDDNSDSDSDGVHRYHQLNGGGGSSSGSMMKVVVSDTVRQGLSTMMQRVEHLAHEVALSDAVELYWACRGIQSRILEKEGDTSHDSNGIAATRGGWAAQPQLQARVERLPFDILPGRLDWNQALRSQDDHHNSPTIPVTQRLQNEIDFCFDTIVTRMGASVTERRATAWIAEEGVGALAYSGKLMPPQPISPVIQNVMRNVEESILSSIDGKENNNQHQYYPRPFFDCALCNHYPDAESACKFHTDPEHGTHWERLTCVVAAGAPRRFAFRPIPGQSMWSEWENTDNSNDIVAATQAAKDHVPAVCTVFPGDIVKMDASCNDDFHHSVYAEQSDAVLGTESQERVSLVLKRAIARSGGQKGHGIAGQGRRSRRKTASVANKATA